MSTNNRLCRVELKKGNDFFRRSPAPCTTEAGGYKLGNIFRETQSTIMVKFDDGSPVETFPAAKVEILIREDNLWKTLDGKTAATEHPPRLKAGDLVMGYCQGGSDEGAWFRARVASVRRDVCDIARDDGEYKCNVPIAGKIRLLQGGFEKMDWLRQLQVPIRNRTRAAVSGIVVVAEVGKALLVEYVDANRQRSTEKKSYTTVVQALLQATIPKPIHPALLKDDSAVALPPTAEQPKFDSDVDPDKKSQARYRE